MILEHDDTLFELDFSELLVSLKLSLSNQKVGGNTSSTDSVNTGTKPKQLSIAGVLPFAKVEHLRQLIQVAEATTASGARQVYNITDETADAADIRQVKFDGDFNVRKMKEYNAWNVTFSLHQVNSIAEANEARALDASVAVGDSAAGQSIAGDDAFEQANQQHGMVYDFLKRVDAALAPNENS